MRSDLGQVRIGGLDRIDECFFDAPTIDVGIRQSEKRRSAHTGRLGRISTAMTSGPQMPRGDVWHACFRVLRTPEGTLTHL